MATYNLAKGPNYDTNGSILENWIRNNISSNSSIHNITIKDAGPIGTLNSLQFVFGESNYLTDIDLSNAQTKFVSYCNETFEDCTNLVNISAFDTNSCVNMSYMFANCTKLVNIPNLNTSRVTKMVYTFRGCNSLNTVPNWDVSNVTDMFGTFANCTNLNTLPNYNTGKCLNFSYTLSNCPKITACPNWNFSVARWLNGTFAKTRITDVNNINTIRVYNASYMFSNSYITNVSNLNLPPYNSGSTTYYPSLAYMFFNCTKLNNISNIDFSGASNMVSTFEYCFNLTGFGTGCNFETLYCTDTTSMFGSCNHLGSPPNFNTSKVTKMGYMFVGCNNLVSVPSFNTINVTTMHNMFEECKKLISVPTFNTSNCTNMARMFYNCERLQSAPNYNAINCTDMSFMFYRCTNLNNAPSLITNSVVNMRSMFYVCVNLKNVPNYNTINCNDMYYTFAYCYNLNTVPNFNTSNVTNMSSMFSSCVNLTTIPNFNTSNVTNMSEMFIEDAGLTSVPNFDTRKVTNMYYMLEAANITTAPSFNTINVKDMGYMFWDCSNLRTIPSYKCDSVECIENTFGSYMHTLSDYHSFGALVNLGKAFTTTTNNVRTTLDLYGISPSSNSLFNTVLSQLYNLASAGKNSQQILVQGESYFVVPSDIRYAVQDKGWHIVAMGVVCLTGDTKLQTLDGLKEIQDIEIGDKVYTYNKDNETIELSEVTKKVSHNNLQTYIFTLKNGEVIKCTARHQFLIHSNHFDEYNRESNIHTDVEKTDYMEARLIDLTDKFIDKNGNEVEIENISIEDIEQQVYEINTEDNGTYLVGNSGIVVKQETIEHDNN